MNEEPEQAEDVKTARPSLRQRAHQTARNIQAHMRVAASELPPEYLARNQSEPDRVAKIKAAAQARREQRNAKRLRNEKATT